MTLTPGVTDDQLGKLFRRMISLADRTGKSVPFDKVMEGLQQLYEGKFPSPARGFRGHFVPSMPILIGGVSKNELIARVKAVRHVTEHAEEMMRRERFTTLMRPEIIQLIDLTPADLGFTAAPATSDLLNPVLLLDWSLRNLDGWTVELCPAEVGPHLAIQYKDQPKNESLSIAMNGIPGSHGCPSAFIVARSIEDGLQLNERWVVSTKNWPLNDRLVFRLCRDVQTAAE